MHFDNIVHSQWFCVRTIKRTLLLLFINITTSGNRTPGSRFYSDLLDTWADCLYPPARTPASFKALGCSYNCRRLTYGSFQLTHMSHDDHAVQLIEPWRPNEDNIIKAFTTLPQGWVSTRKHQYTTAITTRWTESSWAHRALERWWTMGWQKGS